MLIRREKLMKLILWLTTNETRYDGHRDSILRGDDIAAHKDSSAGTTSDDLMRYFSMSEIRGFEDDDKVRIWMKKEENGISSNILS